MIFIYNAGKRLMKPGFGWAPRAVPELSPLNLGGNPAGRSYGTRVMSRLLVFAGKIGQVGMKLCGYLKKCDRVYDLLVQAFSYGFIVIDEISDFVNTF